MFETSICEATLYSYIKKGLFLNLEAVHLPCKGKKKRSYKKVRKVAARKSAGTSIEKRPQEIDTREEMGHWETDCVEGKKKTKETLLVLSERKSRKEIIIKMKDQTAASVVSARIGLNADTVHFSARYFGRLQSITDQSSPTVQEWKGPVAGRATGQRYITVTRILHMSAEQTKHKRKSFAAGFRGKRGLTSGRSQRKQSRSSNWLNAYPRGILGFRSADDVFAEGLAAMP